MEELFFIEEEDLPEPEYPVVEWNGFSVRLLNRHHSLYGDKLACCAKICVTIMEEKQYGIDISGKSVIEFGAGAGLPSLCCCRLNAKNVVATDYNDACLIDNLDYNLRNQTNAKAIGFTWGKDTASLLEANGNAKFDVAILSDVIFNTFSHESLLKSLTEVLDPSGFALVLYTHHRPRCVREELRFFDIAREQFHFIVTELGTVKHEPMFPEDDGDLELRTTAHVVRLQFDSQC